MRALTGSARNATVRPRCDTAPRAALSENSAPYRAHGLLGGELAGTAMFLPTSVLPAVIARHWASLRPRPWAAVVEQALLPIGIGLMAAGVYTLARSGTHDVPTGILAALAGLLLWTRRVPAIVVVLAAGAIGWLLSL